MAGHIHPLKIPTKYYKAIGQVIVGWNLTEALIASILWKIHKIKDVRQGRALIYRLNAGSKLGMLSVSARHFTKSPSLEKELTDFQSRATKLHSKRNLLTHGLWGRWPTQKQWKVFSMRGMDNDLLLIRKEIKKELDPEAIAKDIVDLNRDMKKFMARHRIPPP